MSMTAHRLTSDDVACWVLKSSRPPEELVPEWRAATSHQLNRCVRHSYRLALMAPGQPCLLWCSGRDRPGVHALGTLAGQVAHGPAGPEVAVDLTALENPVARAELLADPAFHDAEVLRMAAGSNPSWLSARQYAAVLTRVAGGTGGAVRLGRWTP
jgi:hypothetical protein